MRANVKGFNFEVTVSCHVGEYQEARDRHEKDLVRDTNETIKDLDLSATIKTSAESYEGEVDLRELVSAIKETIDKNISDQINEQVDNLREEMNDKANKAIDSVKEELFDSMVDEVKKLSKNDRTRTENPEKKC